MRFSLIKSSVFLGLVISLPGCALLGSSDVVFFTKSNVGIDLDSTPATTDIAISRMEGVVEPRYEEGQTFPVLATFKSDVNPVLRFFGMGIGMTFATGEAANTMAYLYDDKDQAYKDVLQSGKNGYKDSKLILKNDPRGWYDKLLARNGISFPLVFTTDTSLGLKVDYLGSMLPTALRVGFNRKEFAYAPLTVTVVTEGGLTTYHTKIPSLLATIDSTTQIGERGDSKGNKLKYIQYFATGHAAEYLSRRKAVRDALLKGLNPEQAAISVLSERIVEKVQSSEFKSDADATRLLKAYEISGKDGYVPSIAEFESVATSKESYEAARKVLAEKLKAPNVTLFSPARQMDHLVAILGTLQ